MPLFGDASSPYDDCVEKVTSEHQTSENWALFMDISDRVNFEGAKGAKNCLLSIKKRLNHRDPHVALFTLSLLDCVWNNGGALFRREVSSNDFIQELTYRATNSNRHVGDKTRELIKKWSENECKRDPSLSLVESLYRDLLEEGYTFDSPEKAKEMARANQKFPNDPNVVSSEQEESDIAKAIALSLSDQKQQYTPIVKEEPKKADTIIQQVRALYDFEAAEANEITFLVGDLINVFDCSDQNWWRGQLARGGKPGLFPSSFVTNDLTAPDDAASIVETAYFEQMSMAQVPLIDAKLAQIDKQHNMLAQIDVAIRDVLASYDNAVQQAHYNVSQQRPGGGPQQPTSIQDFQQPSSIQTPQQPAMYAPQAPTSTQMIPPQQFANSQFQQ
ncbi:hypothetical protein M3Y97_00249300 [Aphelenchoides bicaudatus]|nr:hypothetical protein M3Y97_00249300 [Aphelenchoides bicaudatus]